MGMLTYYVQPNEEGAQVKTLLQQYGISTGTVRKLKQTNGILLNGNPVTVRHTVVAGQRLELLLPETPSQFVTPVPMEIPIVYEDEDILVVNKKAGVPIHPSAGHHEDSLACGVAYYMKGEKFTFRPITRLDRYTSGLVLIAKNSVAAAKLCKQMEQGEIQKVYYAVTQGIPQPLHGEVCVPISREENSVLKRKANPCGKVAKTLYQVEKTKGELALVRVMPVTGRTHQIRVHMAYIGCPLLYDFLYGEEKEKEIFLLQCTGLQFKHPRTEEMVVLTIPCTIW